MNLQSNMVSSKNSSAHFNDPAQPSNGIEVYHERQLTLSNVLPGEEIRACDSNNREN